MRFPIYVDRSYFTVNAAIQANSMIFPDKDPLLKSDLDGSFSDTQYARMRYINGGHVRTRPSIAANKR